MRSPSWRLAANVVVLSAAVGQFQQKDFSLEVLSHPDTLGLEIKCCSPEFQTEPGQKSELPLISHADYQQFFLSARHILRITFVRPGAMHFRLQSVCFYCL